MILLSFCTILAELNGERLVSLFTAAPQDKHMRRMAGRRLSTVRATLYVTRNDFWSASATVSVKFEDGADKPLVSVYFPGTNGNQGSLMPQGLKDGMIAEIEGMLESSEANAKVLRSEMAPPAGVAATIERDASAVLVQNSQRVFVAASLKEVDDGVAEASTGAGNAPAVVNVIVILVHPCGQTVPVTAAQIRSGMFDKTKNTSWAYAHEECSRSMSIVQGDVMGPIEICPEIKNDNDETWRALQKHFMDSMPLSDFYAINRKYKILIQPDEWQDSIGAGSVGGRLSWVRASYYDKASVHLHEVGHNFNLHHSGTPGYEYGDGSSAMGSCCHQRCYHFIHMWQLGFANIARAIESSALASDVIIDIDLPSLSSQMDSGVTMPINNTYFVFSYRASSGFDSRLHSRYHDQVYVHNYRYMTNKRAGTITRLLSSVRHGGTMLIPLSDYKLTWHATVGDIAKVRLCNAAGNTCPCGGECPTTTTTSSSTSLTTSTTSSSSSSSSTSTSPTTSTTSTTSTSIATPAPTTSLESTTQDLDSTTTETTTPIQTSTEATSTTEAQGPLPPSEAVWTSYFSDEQVGGEITSQAMIGLGCRGEYCDSVRTGHSQSIRVHLSDAEWLVSSSDVADLTCDGNRAISRLKCKDDHCGRIMVECSPVMGGDLVSMAIAFSDLLVPQTLHATQDELCPRNSVMTSIKCGGTACAEKRIACQRFEKFACGDTDTCNALGLECSWDGCGRSCGTCEDTHVCLGGSGRCITTGIESDWFSTSHDMPTTGLATTGMGCKGRYCEEARLFLLGMKVETSDLQYSGWISDNTGKRWLWNDETDDQVADCPEGFVITRIECRGKYCDDLRLECATPISWKVDIIGQPWIGGEWFSEESPGRQDCPVGFAMVGLECQKSEFFCLTKCGDYCDNKKIRCRQMTPSTIGLANEGVAGAVEIAAAQAPSKECDESCRITNRSTNDEDTSLGLVGSAVSDSLFSTFALFCISVVDVIFVA